MERGGLFILRRRSLISGSPKPLSFERLFAGSVSQSISCGMRATCAGAGGLVAIGAGKGKRTIGAGGADGGKRTIGAGGAGGSKRTTGAGGKRTIGAGGAGGVGGLGRNSMFG